MTGAARRVKERVYEPLRSSLEVVALAWRTSRRLTLSLAVLTLLAGVLPALTAWIAKLVVDGVVKAAGRDDLGDVNHLLWLIGIEGALIAVLVGTQRGADAARSLLGLRLSDEVRRLILRKAVTLDYPSFEDPDFHDRVQRVRSDAGSRPLAMLRRHFELVQASVKLVAFGALLVQLSPWAVFVVAVAGLPAFLSEVRFARIAFDLSRKKSSAQRERNYLENVLAKDLFAKEVKLFKLAPRLLERFERITQDVYAKEKDVTVRRAGWGFALTLVGTLAFYGAYVWIVLRTVSGHLTIGEMTMYLVVFRQAQSTVTAMLSATGLMFGDHLYLCDLRDFLNMETPLPTGEAVIGPSPGDGLRFENVSFTYPGRDEPALDAVSFEIRPGEILALVGDNGSGKTTIIKLLTRLYEVDSGRICLDGRDIRDWDIDALHRRMGVIFQDFAKFKFTVGENVGLGDVDHIDDEARWREAAERGLADSVIEDLPDGFHTRLGRSFKGGQELSGGQWQKIALSRAFMRRDADILVLDEPTAAIDAEAEYRIFEQVKRTTDRQMVILISHRFSTVRMANTILVLDGGRVIEHGGHEELLARDGRYARLFRLQAQAYH